MDFEISNIYINNEEIPAVPKKRDDVEVKAECSNDVAGTWNKETWSLDLNNFHKSTSCKIFITADSQDVVNAIKDDAQAIASMELSNTGESTGTDGTTNGSGNDVASNPSTGAFLNIFLVLAIIGLAAFVIKKYSKKNKFYKI